MRPFLPYIVSLSLALVMNSGSVSSVQAGDQQRQIMSHSVALMPFFTGKKPAEAETILDVRQEQLGMVEEMIPFAENIMTNLVQRDLERRFGDGVLSQDEVKQAYEKMLAEKPDQTPRELVLNLAKQLGVDYVVAGNVWRFSERTGSAFAISKPASVAFRLHLIDVPNKARIWVETYDKTQQALSDNLFKATDFIKQKGQWLKAEGLAEIGVSDMIKKMPL